MVRGVGFIGAGPGVEALHLPTLERFADRLRTVHIADARGHRAAALAAARGIRSSVGIAALLADPAVDIVAVCSPPALHAEHVHAAVLAGKRALFVEKPLALTTADVDSVVDACRRAGAVLVVGTNHRHDPAWALAKHHLFASGAPVQTITVSVALPPNHPLHATVTEPVETASIPRRGEIELDHAAAAAMVQQIVSGLLVHDLPLVRDLAPRFEKIVFARALHPVGAAVGFRASGASVQLAALLIPEGAEPEWRMTITTAAERLDIRFPPSFVHDGGALVSITGADGRRTVHAVDDLDGYLAEWIAFMALLEGDTQPEWTEIADDARYVVKLSHAAAEVVARGGTS